MATPLPSTTEVCIVGASTTGLACALPLAARNMSFVIVHAFTEAHNDSRSLFCILTGLRPYTINPQLAVNIVAMGIKGQAFRMLDRRCSPYRPRKHIHFPLL
ncbi:hypothetical protein FB45DRAFT_902313 [Roridomyces roridus]|uniref:Uncharacterized protein n=1 Tax=Roridomyces roridus TaxID=1738132 RepID=A0AAD7C3J1_9AGAR|nr:hypothetical protein FB45DRAFT_902313 [Roridomyces roridus]